MSAMPSSPKGRTIEKIDTDADYIHDRGKEIWKLGDEMVDSAHVLQQIKDGADGEEGLSLDALRDKIGDFTDTLAKAGNTYAAVGPRLTHYGWVLGSSGLNIKQKISDAVDDCETAWTQVGSTEDAIPTKPGLLGGPDTDDPDYADAKAASDKANSAFDSAATDFDGYYDSWESAFEDAANSIDKFVDDGIHDSWKDNLDGFVASALEVLKWAGLVLAVACIIIGGPIVLALAAVVSILVLVGTVWQMTRGDAGWDDLAWAAVGVIPLGKLAQFARFRNMTAFKSLGSETLGGMGNWKTIVDNPAMWKRMASDGHSTSAILTSMARRDLNLKNFTGLDVITRAHYGMNLRDLSRTDVLETIGNHYNQVKSGAGIMHDFIDDLRGLGGRSAAHA